MKWYLSVLKKYGVFKGRARRKEFWMFVIFNWIFSAIALVIDIVILGNLLGFSLVPDSPLPVSLGIVSGIYSLLMIIPSLAVTVRRLHDTGKSGGWIFINLVPFIGSIWFLVLMCLDSAPGENKYGPNPKQLAAVQ